MRVFKSSKNDNDSGWLVCWTGVDDENGCGYKVTCDNFHGPGAERDAEIIALLLNWYWADTDATDKILEDTDGEKMKFKLFYFLTGMVIGYLVVSIGGG